MPLMVNDSSMKVLILEHKSGLYAMNFCLFHVALMICDRPSTGLDVLAAFHVEGDGHDSALYVSSLLHDLPV
jgi:hypothetical protein